MKRNNRMTERKRGGLGRGLEVLLADTQAMDAIQSSSSGATDNTQAMQTSAASEEALRNERLELLKEAEALRILLLQFELIVRADLH
jgi:hypothetical protein